MKRAPVTAFEQKVLGVLLVELRRAMKSRAQLSIIVDPFISGGGTAIFAAPNEQGRSYEITDDGIRGGARARAKRTRTR